jgi:hypothetical protein
MLLSGKPVMTRAHSMRRTPRWLNGLNLAVFGGGRGSNTCWSLGGRLGTATQPIRQYTICLIRLCLSLGYRYQCTVWAKRLVLSDSAGTREVRGCAGELRGAADSWHNKAAPTGVKRLNGLV